MLGAVAMTTENLEIGWVVRSPSGERNDMVYFQNFRRTAGHAMSIRLVKQREYVIYGAMAAVLLATIAASYLHAFPCAPSIWIFGNPIVDKPFDNILVLAAPALLVLAIAFWICEPPLLGARAILYGAIGITVSALVKLDSVKSRALNAATSYPSWRHMALLARKAGKVCFEAALYGLRAHDDFHVREITP